MAFVCDATWTARPGHESTVREALVELARISRTEPGCRAYQPYQDPERPTVFRIFELYDDDADFASHSESEHFHRLALGLAIPLLESRERVMAVTLD